MKTSSLWQKIGLHMSILISLVLVLTSLISCFTGDMLVCKLSTVMAITLIIALLILFKFYPKQVEALLWRPRTRPHVRDTDELKFIWQRIELCGNQEMRGTMRCRRNHYVVEFQYRKGWFYGKVEVTLYCDWTHEVEVNELRRWVYHQSRPWQSLLCVLNLSSWMTKVHVSKGKRRILFA